MDDLKFRYRQCEFSLWSIDGETWACPLTSEALWNLPNMCQSRKGHNLKRPLLSLTSSVCCLWGTSVALQLSIWVSAEWILCRKGCRPKPPFIWIENSVFCTVCCNQYTPESYSKCSIVASTNKKYVGVCLPHSFVSRTMCQLNKTVFFFCKKIPPLFIYCVALTEEKKRAGGE